MSNNETWNLTIKTVDWLSIVQTTREIAKNARLDPRVENEADILDGLANLLVTAVNKKSLLFFMLISTILISINSNNGAEMYEVLINFVRKKALQYKVSDINQLYEDLLGDKK